MHSIQDNYNNIIQRIAKTASDCGRNPNEIKIVVVTKTQPIESIIEVIQAGASDLGENYIDEAITKIIALGAQYQVSWHMIGHVQSRKAKLVSNHFHYLHSLDSLKLAEKINQNLIEIDKYLPTWLEFNVSGEETKSGWNIWDEQNWERILGDIENIFSLPRLKLVGVMAMPPYSENPQNARPYFKKLRKFQDYVIQELKVPGFRDLSIGMSTDFEVAIQEGSTCVRIGQAIFGPRKT